MRIYRMLAILLVCVSLLTSCGATSKSSGTENVTANNEQQEQKTPEQNYTKYCASCHGKDGDLGISGAKKFSESVMEQPDRITIITQGKNTMPAFGKKMSEKEISDLAAYTITLGKQ